MKCWSHQRYLTLQNLIDFLSTFQPFCKAQGQFLFCFTHIKNNNRHVHAYYFVYMYYVCSPKKFGPQTSSYSTALLLSSYSMVTSTCSLVPRSSSPSSNIWEACRKERRNTFFFILELKRERRPGNKATLHKLCIVQEVPSTNHMHVNERSMHLQTTSLC